LPCSLWAVVVVDAPQSEKVRSHRHAGTKGRWHGSQAIVKDKAAVDADHRLRGIKHPEEDGTSVVMAPDAFHKDYDLVIDGSGGAVS
jgi:hypothetical protein